jgi:hypothetical protein
LSALAGLCGIDGCSEASLSRSLKSCKSLGADTEKQFGALIGKLEALVARAEPLEPPFRDVEKTKQLLDDLEQNRLAIIIVSNISPEGDALDQQQQSASSGKEIL